jgi:phosphomannomutase
LGGKKLGMRKFIFDVDGTLTPSRGIINAEFQCWFIEFVYDNDVYLVTGSDYPKTLEQLGKTICENVDYVFNCSGNDVWYNGTKIYTNEWTLPEDAHEWLSEELAQSEFPLRTGLHFEHRPGMVNFSVVGRNADLEQRAQYVEWDTEREERQKIASWFNAKFPELEARPGGETGIDISVRGSNKSQILKEFAPEHELHFFGDRMDEGGNDYPLAKAILDNELGYCYNVKNWEATWSILKQLNV